jgi:hypothetical protein
MRRLIVSGFVLVDVQHLRNVVVTLTDTPR